MAIIIPILCSFVSRPHVTLKRIACLMTNQYLRSVAFSKSGQFVMITGDAGSEIFDIRSDKCTFLSHKVFGTCTHGVHVDDFIVYASGKFTEVGVHGEQKNHPVDIKSPYDQSIAWVNQSTIAVSSERNVRFYDVHKWSLVRKWTHPRYAPLLVRAWGGVAGGYGWLQGFTFGGREEFSSPIIKALRPSVFSFDSASQKLLAGGIGGHIISVSREGLARLIGTPTSQCPQAIDVLSADILAIGYFQASAYPKDRNKLLLYDILAKKIVYSESNIAITGLAYQKETHILACVDRTGHLQLFRFLLNVVSS